MEDAWPPDIQMGRLEYLIISLLCVLLTNFFFLSSCSICPENEYEQYSSAAKILSSVSTSLPMADCWLLFLGERASASGM